MLRHLNRLISFFLIFLITLPAFSLGSQRYFIIDTDVSIDDAIAILYLFSRPDIDVKAITIATTGEAPCSSALQNVKGLIKLSNIKDLPVACGRDKPLVGQHEFPKWIKDAAANLLGMSEFLPKTLVNENQNALQLLQNTLMASDKKIDILAIGPLTNIAELLQQRPDLKAKIGRIFIMGGAIDVPGNLDVEPSIKNKKAEWNFYIDPEAVKVVFASKVPITLVSLDITNQLPIDQAFYQRLALFIPHTPIGNFINQLFERNKKPFLTWGWYFWDPLAAVIATEPSIGVQKIRKLRVLTTPEDLSGSLIEDPKNGDAVSVCEQVPAQEFEMMALNALFNRH